mmetsp:Transcript_20081/g.50205  ORF Transcript_20081/g.50205 Transcript_20081/m.50205 type:complete len:315 (-) Transcript_20081:336-1280(-)
MANSQPLTSDYVPQVDETDAPNREEPRASAPAPQVAQVNQFPAQEPVRIHIQPEARYVQYGQWKDGICECCTKGGWPSLFMSWCFCCWPCLFGQVASRIRWSPGLPKAFGKSPYTQWVVIMSFLVGVYMICETSKMHENAKAIEIHLNVIKRCQGQNDPYAPCGGTPEEERLVREFQSNAQALDVFSYLTGITTSILIMFLRMRTRSKFLIPSSCEAGPGDSEARRITFLGLCEDLWCAACCGCCALAQMSRHTYAAEEFAPCNDPGPAESMEPQFAGQAHQVTQMSVMHPVRGMPGASVCDSCFSVPCVWVCS